MASRVFTAVAMRSRIFMALRSIAASRFSISRIGLDGIKFDQAEGAVLEQPRQIGLCDARLPRRPSAARCR